MPIPFLVVIIGSLAMLNIKDAFNPPLLHATLTTLLIGIPCSLGAYIAAKSYLLSGVRTLILFGCGILTYGFTMTIGIWLLSPPGGINVGVTITNVGPLAASVLFFVSALLALTGAIPQAPIRRRSAAMLTYLGVLACLVFFTIITLQGALPPFYVAGIGPTPMRQYVLSTATALFAVSSVIFMILYFKSRPSILYWCSLSLALITLGLLAWLLQGATPSGSPIIWTGRVAQYLGGIYFLIAVLTARGTSTS